MSFSKPKVTVSELGRRTFSVTWNEGNTRPSDVRIVVTLYTPKVPSKTNADEDAEAVERAKQALKRLVTDL